MMKTGKIAEALAVLGPSEKQVDGQRLMRTDSDKLIADGRREMAEETGKRGSAAIEVDGVRYVPLKAAVAALGGTASYDGSNHGRSNNGISSTIQTAARRRSTASVKGDKSNLSG